MYGYFEVTGMIEALLISIPESVSLLVFGFGLMGVAVAGRWLIERIETNNDEKVSSQGLR